MLIKSDYITDKSQLVDYFFQSCKKESDFKIGVEFERLGVDSKTFHAIPYSGERGVHSFLKNLSQQEPYEVIEENGNILGLKGECCDISLEPGAQLECSTMPIAELEVIANKISLSNQKFKELGDEMGIIWIGYGIQPLSVNRDIEMIPKKRYDIMSNYLPNKGSHALVMMKETAGIQASIDYSSEEDAMKKLKVSLAISPYLTAMFANSPIRSGNLTGYKSFRAYGWLHTDNDRCGLISKKIFNDDFGFSDYVEVLLDVPMFFKHTGMTFREFIAQGGATMDDWMLHMTTFFPEVRMKNFLEVRNCDCQKSDMALAFPALIKGILYNPESLGHAWELVKHQSWEQRNYLRHHVPKNGITEISDIARELVAIAEISLGHEAIYLEKLKELLEDNKTPADIIIKNWNTAWNGDVKNLINHCQL